MLILRGGIGGRFKVLAHCFQFVGRIESIIGPAVFHQLLGILTVLRLALALAVRTIAAAVRGTFIGLQPAPAQALHNIFFRAGHKTRLVGILDAQDEITAVVAGKQVVVQNRSNAAQVQAAGGTGPKSDPYFFRHRVQR